MYIKIKFMGIFYRCFFKNLYWISNVYIIKLLKICNCIYKYGIYINLYIYFCLMWWNIFFKINLSYIICLYFLYIIFIKLILVYV